MGGTSHVAVADGHAHRQSLSLSFFLVREPLLRKENAVALFAQMPCLGILLYRGTRAHNIRLGSMAWPPYSSRSSESALVQMSVDHLVARGACCVKRKLDNSVQGFCV